VLRCRLGDGRAAVLELCPDPEVGRAEARAPRGWAPSGRVPLVWGHDAAAGSGAGWPGDRPGRSSCTATAALGVDDERLWAWCRASAAMLAASTSARGGSVDRVAALLSLGP
jgi:hypothetical protein